MSAAFTSNRVGRPRTPARRPSNSAATRASTEAPVALSLHTGGVQTEAMTPEEVAQRLARPVGERLHSCLNGTYLHSLLAQAHRESSILLVRRRIDRTGEARQPLAYMYTFVADLAAKAGRDSVESSEEMLHRLFHTPPPGASDAQQTLWALTALRVETMDDVLVEAFIEGDRTLWTLRYESRDGSMRVSELRQASRTPPVVARLIHTGL